MLANVSKILVVLFLTLISGAAFAQNIVNPSEIIYERYFLTKTKGNDIGFIHILQRKTAGEDGSQVISTERHMEQRFKRGNDNMEIIQDNIFMEDMDGRPVRFSFKSSSKGENTLITGKFNRKTRKINVESTVNGIKESKTIDNEGNILFPYAIDKLYKENRAKQFDFSTIEPGVELQILKVMVTRLQYETIREKKLNGAYMKYSVKTSALSNVESFEWRDESGRVMKETSTLFEMQNIAVDKNEISKAQSNYDVAKQSTMPVEGEITDPDQADSIIYKITAQNTPVEGILPSSETQSITQVEENSAWLNVTSQIPGNYGFQYPVIADNYSEYLQSGPYIITDSPKIQETVDSLIAGETDAVRIAEKMRTWVYENIENKNFSMNFANSVDTLESNSGDCTEHSILLAALLRAAGIPAKITVGLVYTDKPAKSFGYHMWVQAYAGRWINLDPSLPYKTFTPSHIALAESALNSISDKNNISLNIIKTFSALKIEIVNISKPIVRDTGNQNQIEVNLKNKNMLSTGIFTDVNINEARPSASGTGSGIQNVGIAKEEVKPDYMKEAFFAYNRGDTEKALSMFKQYNKTIDPDDDAAKMKLVLKLINMAYFNFAAEVIKEINNREIWGSMISEIDKLYFPKRRLTDENEDKLVSAFYILTYKDDPNTILKLTEDIAESYDFISYMRARVFAKKKEYDNAEYSINRALRLYPDSVTYNFERIRLYLEMNDALSASDALGQISLLADRYKFRDSEFKKNIQIYDYWLKSSMFKTNVAQSAYYQASYYKAKGENFTALDILNKVVYRQKQLFLYELMADIFYEVDQYKTAKKFYEKALKMDPNSLISNIGMGNVSFIEGNDTNAAEYYKKALKLSPGNIDVLSAMARFQYYTGDRKKAYNTFLQILSIDKENKFALYNLGIILANLGKTVEAEKLLKKTLSLDPMADSVWLDLAKTQIVKKDYVSAAKYLKNFNSLKPNDANYYYYLAVIFGKNGNKADAKQCLRKALELNPNLANELK